ncbi:cytochrome P450 [Achaetomium macrosporum]|uniref:Cytochrome P450 n=1 Tax=Achaetomium macrosporum TaxID=79813 RepID=A0AAN7C4G3_9PEZI|nr:cytochrome P450 [Achaetomium macrosporum]
MEITLWGIVAVTIYRLCFHPLRHYPGPRLWAVSRLPWLSSTVRGTIIHDLQALHEQYGPVVRTAPNELSYTTPAATKSIYQSNPEFPKDPMHLPISHNGRPGILAADHDDHRRYRRLLSGAFSDRGMRTQQAMIQSHVDLLIKQLKKRCGADQPPVDIVEWYNWTTFDIIGDLAFGESFGCLANAATHEWIASIQGNVKAIPVINALRRLGLAWTIPLLAPRRLLAVGKRNAQFAVDKVDQRRRHGASPRGDLWDGIMAKNEKEGTMTRDEMISNASNIVLAGSETSATLLSGCTWLLLQPENEEKLRLLIRHVRTSFKSEDEIDLISVGRLDYMLAVIDEALRLYPPVPMQSNRIVNGAGAVIDGRWVPGGTSVALQLYAACRSPSNFHQPDKFLPERWLSHADPGSPFAADRREASQPFSIGPRNCIGRQLAYAEMRLILAKILWHFDLELDEAAMRGRDWMGEQGVWILWDKGPLWVRPKLRAEAEV